MPPAKRKTPTDAEPAKRVSVQSKLPALNRVPFASSPAPPRSSGSEAASVAGSSVNGDGEHDRTVKTERGASAAREATVAGQGVPQSSTSLSLIHISEPTRLALI
eukprot:6364763-Alexandrium_andersonii.AAC.1